MRSLSNIILDSKYYYGLKFMDDFNFIIKKNYALKEVEYEHLLSKLSFRKLSQKPMFSKS